MKSILQQLIAAVMVIISAAEMRAQVSFRSEPQMAPGQVLIKFKNEKNTNTTVNASRLETLGITVIKPLSPLPIAVCKFSAEKNIEDVLRACRALPNVEYVEPNYYVYATEGGQEVTEDGDEATAARKGAAMIPNDPRFAEQWNLNQANDYDIDAPEAWNITTGSNEVIVGIVDTGIDYDHEDLKANIWLNAGESGGGKESNGVDDDKNGYVDDWRGWNFADNNNDPFDDNVQGTHAAGIIGAVGNNGVGVAGVNWTVKLMALKFLHSDGSGSLADAITAIIYATQNGAKILNNSWGGSQFSRALEDAIQYAHNNGVLFVASAGRSGSDNDAFPVYPANYDIPNIISVTSSDQNDRLVGNYGRRTVDIAAPGVGILSTRPLGRYQSLSSAAPHVSGVCALVWAQFPNFRSQQVIDRVLSSTDRKPEFIDRLASGGRLNAANALSSHPLITYTTDIGSTDDTVGPYLIKTVVVDEGIVASVRLIYALNLASTDTLEMTKGENDTLSAAIPGQPLNTIIHYAVLASDNDGNSTISPIFRLEINRPSASLPAPAFILDDFPVLTNNASPSFQWESVAEAASYHVGFLDSLYVFEFRDTTKSTFYIPPFSLPDGVWHIRVRSADQFAAVSQWSPSDAGERFTVDTTPPTEPLLREAEIVAPTIRTLRWQASTDATSGLRAYLVHINNSPNPESGFTIFLDPAFTQYTTIPLGEAQWYWRVTAIDYADNESTSLIGSFIIEVSNPPVAPAILLETTITNDNTPTIPWTNVDNAASFRLQYSRNQSFFNLVDITGLNEKSYTFPNPLEDGDYYFRVFARRAGGAESAASAIVRLTIDTKAPNASILKIARGASFTSLAEVAVNLSANEADSVRLLGDFINKDLAKFRFFSLENQIGTRDTVSLTPEDGLKNLQAQFKDLAGNIANAFGAILLDTQGPVFPAGTPQLSPATPAIKQEVIVALARPTDGNGSGVKTFKLHYRRGGEAWRGISFNANNQARIPSDSVTHRGVDYQIVADDSARNLSILKNGGLDFFSIPAAIRAEEAGRSKAFPGGPESELYRLISLPLFVENITIAEAFANLGTYGRKNDYRLWRYDGARSLSEGPQIIVQPGESYFLIKRRSGSLSNKSAGSTAKASDAAVGNIPGWQLRENDWTFIGNPFNFEIPFTDLKLKRRDTTLAALANLWAYEGEGENNGWTRNIFRAAPWEGFIVFNDSLADTLVYDPLSSTASMMSLVDLPRRLNKVESYHELFGEGGWGVRVWAESEGVHDNENYFGAREGANMRKDGFDLYEPPFLPGRVSLSFVQQDNESVHYLAADIRPVNQDGYLWTLQLKGVGGSKVRVQFDGLASLPAELEICLLDQEARFLRDIRIQPVIEVYLPQSSGTKQLHLLVGQREFVEKRSAGFYSIPQSFALRQNYPNPFNPATVIRYELPVAGKVTLRLYNVLGAEILALAEEAPHEPGYYEKVVDLRAFASGIYFYRLSVSGGQSFAQTKKMVLTK